jgi:predicted dienelactone hydrolase
MLMLELALAALIAQPAAEPLPAPTGPHPTGRTSFHWKDAAREELETKAPDDKRELMVHVFYPADPDASGERAAYLPDADAMRGVWSEAHLKQVGSMRAFSRENAAPRPGDARHPVVIFSPGGGMKGLTYHALLEDLASHGWVAVAIDPPYNARRVRFPDGRVLGNLSPAERGWPETRNPEEHLRTYRERVVHWARDVSFVIDQLAALDRGSGPLARRLDLERGVGVAGHSRGGQAAGTVRLLDARVRGGVNLDGAIREYAWQPVKDDDAGGQAPFLWIQKAFDPPPTEEQLKRARRTRAEYDAEVERIVAIWHRRLGLVTGGALRVIIDRPGLTHIDFSDEPFWDPMPPEVRAGKLATIADTRAWLRAFFDATVHGEWAGLKALASKTRPEVTVHVFGKLWPEAAPRVNR